MKPDNQSLYNSSYHHRSINMRDRHHNPKEKRPNSKWYTLNFNALPLKLAYFIYGLHRMSYKPFLIVFFSSIGLNKAEAGLLVGLMPLGSIIGNPFWGIVADKTKRHRTILTIQFIGAILLMSSQPFIAKYLGDPVKNTCPLKKTSDSFRGTNSDPIDELFHLLNNTGGGHRTTPVFNMSVSRNTSVNPYFKSTIFRTNVTDFYEGNSIFNTPFNTNNSLPSPLADKNIIEPPMETAEDKSHRQLLFTTLLIFIILQDFFQGSYLSFTDSAVMRYIEQQPYIMDYGFQRMISGPGAALGVPLVNLWLELINTLNLDLSISCYVVMHTQYVIASIMYLTILVFLYGRISPTEQGYECLDQTSNGARRKPNNQKIHIAVFKKLTEVKVVFLLVTLLLAGISLTLFSSFTMAYMIELGASRTLLSLAYSTALMSLMLGYFFSTKLIKFFGGPWNVFIIGFIAYTIRYMVYGFMGNPWLVLTVQPLHLLNRAVLNAAAVTYIKSITDPDILTSIYAIMDSIQTGIGWIIGNSFGGYVYHLYGGRILYISVACIDLLWAFFIFIFSRSRFAKMSPSFYVQERPVETEKKRTPSC